MDLGEMTMRKALAGVAVSLLLGCAQVTVIPFQPEGQAAKTYPPTNPRDVGIYRSTYPFKPFTEIGAITYRSGSYGLASMYDELRNASAKYGAQAVVDVKVSKETHTEEDTKNVCTPETNCDASGNCTTDQECHMETVSEDVTTFLITGSMIHQ